MHKAALAQPDGHQAQTQLLVFPTVLFEILIEKARLLEMSQLHRDITGPKEGSRNIGRRELGLGGPHRLGNMVHPAVANTAVELIVDLEMLFQEAGIGQHIVIDVKHHPTSSRSNPGIAGCRQRRMWLPKVTELIGELVSDLLDHLPRPIFGAIVDQHHFKTLGVQRLIAQRQQHVAQDFFAIAAADAHGNVDHGCSFRSSCQPDCR